MTPSQLTPPTKATLRSKGITLEMWYAMLDIQDGKCPICGRYFTNQLRPVIDHEHKKGFRKMKAEKKAECVRGLLCNYDNRRRIPTNSKGISALEISYNVYQYLSDYSLRGE
jgi:hypothetical protein